jgi:ribulose-phosphate 3-epimerase
MEIIPVINCDDFNCVKKKLAVLDGILPPDNRRIHIDVSDGQYAVKPEWNNPEELGEFLKENNMKFDIGVHFMVKMPCDGIRRWASLINKATVPLDCDECTEHIAATCQVENVAFSVSIPPDNDVREAARYAGLFKEFQILAVPPGPSGQKMSEGTIQKIKELREMVPSAIIEVDGGVNPETIPELARTGADIALSGSYIFNSADPKSAYLELKEAINGTGNNRSKA